MGDGIRAEVRINGPGDCPVARLSGEADGESYSISKTAPPGASDEVVEEFMLDTDGTVPTGEGIDEVFSYGSKQVYRFTRDRGRGCACECVERFDCPVVDAYTRGDDLFLTFHAPDMDRLSEIIGDLRDRYGGIDLRRLLRSETDHADSNLVFVDKGQLTDRQREVLVTANEMGYFEHPKGANAGEVADELGITTSTFSEHLAAAQRKLLDAILGGAPTP